MPITNTAAFAQYRRIYSATVTTANTNYRAPTNTAMLTVAGPDGSLITRMASIARATVAQTQMQYYLSKDGGTTFTILTSGVIAACTLTQTIQMGGLTVTQIDGSAISETNPIPLAGVTSFGRTASTAGGVTIGTANVQTLPFATGVTALTAGVIVDFEAWLTNTSSMTLAIGTSAAASVVRDSTGTAVSAGDITTGFRYRVRCDGSFWRLFMTDRLYVATGITLAGGITTTVEQADF